MPTNDRSRGRTNGPQADFESPKLRNGTFRNGFAPTSVTRSAKVSPLHGSDAPSAASTGTPAVPAQPLPKDTQSAGLSGAYSQVSADQPRFVKPPNRTTILRALS